ncbi:protein Niban 2-like [Ciona intestinalis]
MGKALSLLILSGTKIEGHSADQVYQSNVDYAKVFVKRYEAAYMWFYLQKVNREYSGKDGCQKWQLRQRNWQSYNRPIKQGSLCVLSKNTGKKWKQLYCVLHSNYTLEFYKSKEDYEQRNSQLFKAEYSGYKVLTDVDTYLHKKLEISCCEFGYVNQDLVAFSRKVTMIGRAGKRPTQHIFSSSHTWRATTYFAAETAIEKESWVRVLRDAIRHLEGVHNKDEVGNDAFMFAIEQSIRLQEFAVDRSLLSGTQEEILADMMIEIQSQDCKVVLLPHITGGLVTKYKTWNFIMFETYKWMKKIIGLEYTQQRLDAEIKCKEQRVNMIAKMPEIFDTYENCAKAIEGELVECFDSVLKSEILPHVPRVISTLYDSLMSPIRGSRELFVTLVEGVVRKISMSSPDFVNNIDQYFLSTLDYAPRNPEFMHPTSNTNMIALSQIQAVFPESNLSPFLLSIYTHQQKLLDSAICTFEALCGDAVTVGNGKLTKSLVTKIQARVLKKLDFDILLAQKRLFRTVIQSATMEHTRAAIEHTCKGKMSGFEYLIDPSLSTFMPINNVFTSVLTKHFNDLFEPVLKSSLKQLNMSKAFRSSSQYSSISSCITEEDAKPSPAVMTRASQEVFEDLPVFTDAMDGETGEAFTPDYKEETGEEQRVGGFEYNKETKEEVREKRNENFEDNDSPDSGILTISTLNGEENVLSANFDFEIPEKDENEVESTENGLEVPEISDNEHKDHIPTCETLGVVSVNEGNDFRCAENIFGENVNLLYDEQGELIHIDS